MTLLIHDKKPVLYNPLIRQEFPRSVDQPAPTQKAIEQANIYAFKDCGLVPKKQFQCLSTISKTRTSCECLQSHYGLDSSGKPVDQGTNTQGSRMFDRSLNLYDAAARFENAQSLVSDCAEKWSDRKATKTSTKNAINALKNTVSPFLNLATDLAFEPA